MELALANRRKYRMSCVHACEGSFGAITRVCQMGWGGHLSHLASPSFTLRYLAPESMDSKANGCWRYPPFLQIVIEILIEKVVKNSRRGNRFLLFFWAFCAKSSRRERLSKFQDEIRRRFLLLYFSKNRSLLVLFFALLRFLLWGASGQPLGTSL